MRVLFRGSSLLEGVLCEGKGGPVPQDVTRTDSPPSLPEGGVSSPPVPPKEKRSVFFKASMLDLGGRSVTGYQSKGKEGKFLDTLF
jgi:hypothetical protein